MKLKKSKVCADNKLLMLLKKNCKVSFAILVFSFISCSQYETLSVKQCTPTNYQSGVSSSAVVDVIFSARVNKGSVNNQFSLSNSNGAVNGNVVWESDYECKFVPSNTMTNGRYVITIGQSITDVNGNEMSKQFLSEFCVGTTLEGPVVVQSMPQYIPGGVSGVGLNQNITITFSEAMNTVSAQNAFSLNPSVPGYFQWSQNNTVLEYVLTGALTTMTRYSFSVGSGAQDAYGNAIKQSYTAYFLTGTTFVQPKVLGMYKSGDSSKTYYSTTAINTCDKKDAFTVVFSEGMDHTVTQNSFQIVPQVSGVFTWELTTLGDEMTFTPSSSLGCETTYEVTVSTSAADPNGTQIPVAYNALIDTNDTTSRYFSVSSILTSNAIGSDGLTLQIGSGDDNQTISPSSGSVWLTSQNMPCPLTINTVSLQSSDTIVAADQQYYFQIALTNSLGQPVIINEYSILGGEVFLDCLSSAYTQASISLIDFVTVNSITYVVLGLSGLPPHQPDSSGNIPTGYYRVTIAGGSNGIQDSNGNVMQNSFIFEFQVN